MQNKNKNKNKNKTILALKLLVATLVIAGLAHTMWGQKINTLAISFFSPFYKGVAVTTRSVKEQVEFFISLRDVASRNKELQEQVLQLQSEVMELGRLKEENERLRRQLALSVKGEKNLLSAEVVGWEPIGSENYFMINKGADNNLEKNMPVVYEGYLVGQVVLVDNNTARVQAVTDPNMWVFAVDKDSETRTKGVVSGYMADKLIMRKIFEGEEIQVGDVIVTSGEAGTLPSGLILGRVARVVEKGVLKEAVLDLLVDLRNLSEVFVYR
ncbi:MAG: rod shape-determining protein MreC [Patescibacteria group bacterium]|nr:rod shape-determining protein MreC [Patescibacteria group bacterium]